MSVSQHRLTQALADRYNVECELGEGGMATVYLAEDLKHKRKVAVKVLRPELAAVLGPDRFIREIEIAAQLHHPHILALYDSGESDGFLYYVMPLVKGQSLRDRIAREGALPLADAVRILRDVMDALAEAHENGVVHRDIKPDNVMLSGRHALVMDFGVAKAVSEAGGQQELTTAGMALGTPAYMAPEQAVGDPNVDHRADIYAAGVMAYEMLTGETPFTGTNAQQILSAHVMQVPVPVSTHRETTPDTLNDLVMRCLHKKPVDRWQHAAEVIPHLEMLGTTEGGVTPAAAPTPVKTDDGGVAQGATLLRTAARYTVSAAVVAGAAYAIMYVVGLPDWVFSGAVALLMGGLPVALITSHSERHPETRLVRLFTRRRSRLAGVVAFGMLTLVAATYMASRALGIGPAATLRSAGILTDSDVFVLADFENNTESRFLGEAITTALRDDLSQSAVVPMMDGVTIFLARQRMQVPRGPLDVTVAREVAVRQSAKAVLYGEVNRIGEIYAVSATLESTDGETLVRLRETAAGEDAVVEALARLSRGLRAAIGESVRDLRSTPRLPQVTTHSLDALRKYAEAIRLQGRMDDPIGLLNEAVAIDSAFAQAHRRLFTSYSNSGREPGKRLVHLLAAYRHRDRATEIARLEIESMYANVFQHDYARAAALYERIKEITGRPSNNLAFSYVFARRFEDAETTAREYLDLWEGRSPGAHWNLIQVLVNQGHLEEADLALDQLGAAYPTQSITGFASAGIEYARGRRQQARAIGDSVGEVHRGNPGTRAGALRFRALVALGQGEIGEAGRLFDEQLTVQQMRGLNASALGVALNRAAIAILVRARWDSTRLILEQVEREHDVGQLDPPSRLHLRFVELAARGGDPQLARRWMDRWRSDLDSLQQAASTQLPAALGEIALAVGDPVSAIAHFREWDRVIGACGMCVVAPLARAYEVAGESDSARTMYQRFVDAPWYDRYINDAWDLAPALVKLGELYEANGDRTNAVKYYNAFVDLWQGSDADLQVAVEDIRQRVARLVGERSS